MNDQLKTFLDNFLHALVRFRMLGLDQRGDYHDWSAWGRLRGRLALATELLLITTEQEKLLSSLIDNADIHKGRPFPDERNAGPFISWWELHKRTLATHLLEKPQAQVQADEKLEPVSAPAPRRELRLLCLLGRHGSIIPAIPALTMRAMPPRVDKLAACSRWSSSSVPGLYLRHTHAVAPSAEVLARLQRHGQANALRADTRTVQLGVTA